MMRLIIDRFLSRLVSKVEQLRPQRVIDLGCGEGIVAQRLQHAAERITEAARATLGFPGHHAE